MVERICSITRQPFEVLPDELDAYSYFGIPIPNISHQERIRRQLSLVPASRFSWRHCDITGERIYSLFPSKTPFPVVSTESWLSGAVDAMSFGMSYDFSKSFFEVLYDLFEKVPRPASLFTENFQSRGCSDVIRAKNSFWVADGADIESCYYSSGIWNSSHCLDCYFISDSDHCYECIDCHECSQLRWSEHSLNCHASWFLLNCTNCSNCLFCANLQGKEYYIFNQPTSKEKYEETLQKWQLANRYRVESAKEQFAEFFGLAPIPEVVATHPDSVSGNYLLRSDSVHYSFECIDSSNLVLCTRVTAAENCLDIYSSSAGVCNSAQSVAIGGGAERVFNSIECWNNVSELNYCMYCENGRELLGCIGLRGKEYCIFNRQYTEADYFALKNKIIQSLKEKNSWGNYLPSPFAHVSYNDSVAQDYMPLNKVQAKLLQVQWSDREKSLKPSQLLGENMEGLDERFSDVPVELSGLDSIPAGSVFLCELSGQPFQFSSEEIQLYRALSVAPPARSPEQRFQGRLSRISPRRLITRPSSLNPKQELQTAYPLDWPNPVYSVSEWQQVVAENSA